MLTVMTRDFNWVSYLPYVLCALGWLILMVLALWWLNRQVGKHDEQVRAKAAKELGKRLNYTSSGTEIFWAVDDPTPGEVDPPVTRPYINRWESP